MIDFRVIVLALAFGLTMASRGFAGSSDASAVEGSNDSAHPVTEPARPLAMPAEADSWLEPVFGRYHIQLNFYEKPDFNDGLRHYQDLYGTPGRYGMMGADYTPWGWFINLGFGLRGGVYSDHGHAAKDVAPSGEVTLDENGSTTLTLMPFQFLGVARLTPFPRKWLVLEAWYGRERAYFQEVRDVKSGSAMLDRQRSGGVVGDSALTNKGWLSGNVTGIAGSVLLNPLDEGSVRSMARSLGLGFVYLTVFKEQVTYLDKEHVSFGRSTTGVGFTFETVK